MKLIKINSVIAVVLLLFTGGGAGSEVFFPEDPKIPGVYLDNKKSESPVYPATLRLASKHEIKGAISIPVSTILIPAGGNRKVHVDKIRSVEIICWKGREQGKGAYVFYPSSLRITLWDKSVYNCGNIRYFNRIRFSESGGKGVNYYTYFYDYRKKKKWLNSGKSDISYPEKNPHEKTVVEIIFHKKEEPFSPENILMKFLKAR